RRPARALERRLPAAAGTLARPARAAHDRRAAAALKTPAPRVDDVPDDAMDQKRKPKAPTPQHVPSGDSSDVALGARSGGHATSPPDLLHVCFHCSGELVYPLDW